MGQQVTGIVTGQRARITLQSLKQTLIPPVYTQWYMLMLPYQPIFLSYSRVAFCLWIALIFIFLSSPFKLNLQDIATVLIAWKHLFWMKNWNSAWHQSKTTFQHCWFFSEKERERQGSTNLIFTLRFYWPHNVNFDQKLLSPSCCSKPVFTSGYLKKKKKKGCSFPITMNGDRRCQASKKVL